MLVPNRSKYREFASAAELVRTVEVVGADQRTYRIEILKRLGRSARPEKGNNATPFTARYYVQSVSWASTGADGTAYPSGIWVNEHRFPRVDEPSSERALNSALRWLAEYVGSVPRTRVRKRRDGV